MAKCANRVTEFACVRFIGPNPGGEDLIWAVGNEGKSAFAGHVAFHEDWENSRKPHGGVAATRRRRLARRMRGGIQNRGNDFFGELELQGVQVELRRGDVNNDEMVPIAVNWGAAEPVGKANALAGGMFPAIGQRPVRSTTMEASAPVKP